VCVSLKSIGQQIKILEHLQHISDRPEECDSDKCDLKMAAIATIMVAILAAIFNMVAKTHTKFRSAPITKKIDI
jgi:metal-dependent HD superfamily phosphatase/phosphodiesterase